MLCFLLILTYYILLLNRYVSTRVVERDQNCSNVEASCKLW